jgi:hypothetical protein
VMSLVGGVGSLDRGTRYCSQSVTNLTPSFKGIELFGQRCTDKELLSSTCIQSIIHVQIDVEWSFNFYFRLIRSTILASTVIGM